jgi:pimeloyl-ACP methyl ester carboxylesterase
MSPRAMGEFIVRVADAFGLEQPHVVGPDVGTAASLFAAALYPGRLRSLAVGTGGIAVPLQLGCVLKEGVEAPSLEPYREIDGRQVVTVAIAMHLVSHLTAMAELIKQGRYDRMTDTCASSSAKHRRTCVTS